MSSVFQFVFTDSTNKVLFTTTDFGKTLRREQLEFHVSDISFHEEEPETFVVLDKSDDARKVGSAFSTWK